MEELEPRRGPGRPPNPRPEQPQELPQRRVARKPFGAMTQKGALPEISGHFTRWFNDWPGRIARAQEAGYAHVLGKDIGLDHNNPVSQVCGTAEGGGPLHRYAMKIPIEWYTEDMIAQQKAIDEKESIMKRGDFERKKGDGRYVGKEGITIKHGA